MKKQQFTGQTQGKTQPHPADVRCGERKRRPNDARGKNKIKEKKKYKEKKEQTKCNSDQQKEVAKSRSVPEQEREKAVRVRGVQTPRRNAEREISRGKLLKSHLKLLSAFC